eukprot:scaffold24880_cov48-Phaeocystis_antarctica.AAC.4
MPAWDPLRVRGWSPVWREAYVVCHVGRDVVGGVGRGVAHGGRGGVGLLCDRRAEHLLEVAAWQVQPGEGLRGQGQGDEDEQLLLTTTCYFYLLPTTYYLLLTVGDEDEQQPNPNPNLDPNQGSP